MRAGETLSNRAWIVGPIAYVDISTATYPRAVALVDAADLTLLLDDRGRWRRSKSGYVWRWTGPVGATQYVFLHRYLRGLAEGDGRMVDHANGDGLDNRRANLREATSAQNNANSRPRAVGHLRGVRLRPTGVWQAQITAGSRQVYLGTYRTEREAALVYDRAAVQVHGQFAQLNFPEEQAA